MPEGRRPGARAHERGRGLLRPRRPELRRQDCRRRAHDPEVYKPPRLRVRENVARVDKRGAVYARWTQCHNAWATLRAGRMRRDGF